MIFTLANWLGSSLPVQEVPMVIFFHLLTVVLFLRFGLLTMATTIFVNAPLSRLPLTTDLSAWYSGSSIAVVAILLALAGWAFHTSLGGKKLFSGNLLED